MASERQLIANRLNSRRSTGPRTLAGKLRARRNAIKHGLTARTVIDVFENEDDFRLFYRDISSDYAPKSQTEHELIQRLAALLWRLRRAHAVETGLLGIQGRLQRDVRIDAEQSQADMFSMLGLEQTTGDTNDSALLAERQRTDAKARAFLRLCNINGGALDRLNRYEVSLWRQAVQVMLLLSNTQVPVGR